MDILCDNQKIEGQELVNNSGILSRLLKLVKKEVNNIDSKENIQEVLDYSNLRLYIEKLFKKIESDKDYFNIIESDKDYFNIIYNLLNKNIINKEVFKNIFLETLIKKSLNNISIDENIYILELGLKTKIFEESEIQEISKKLCCKLDNKKSNLIEVINNIYKNKNSFEYSDIKNISKLITLGLLTKDDIKNEFIIKLEAIFNTFSDVIEGGVHSTGNIYINLKDILNVGFFLGLINNEEQIKNQLIKIITYNTNKPFEKYHNHEYIIPLIEILFKNKLLNDKENKKFTKRIRIGFYDKNDLILKYTNDLKEYQDLIIIGKINKDDIKENILTRVNESFNKVSNNILNRINDSENFKFLIDLIKFSLKNSFITITELKKEYKEEINILANNFFNEDSFDSNYAEYINLGLINFNNYKGNILEKQYEENLKIYNNIMQLTDIDFELVGYLDKIFLDTNKLKDLEYFLKMNAWQYKKVDIKKAINNKNGFYYGFFIDCVENKNDIVTPFNQIAGLPYRIKIKIEEILGLREKLEFVDYNNFTDFMDDEELFFSYNTCDLDKNIIHPFTKQWFLEKTERKGLLKPEKIKILQEYGLIASDLGPKSVQYFIINNILSFEQLYDFINNKVIKSEKDSKIFKNSQIKPSSSFNKLFSYFLENKQKSLMGMISKINNAIDLGLNIDISKFKTIDDFIIQDGKINYETLKINYETLKINYEKLLKINGERNINKKISRFNNFIKYKDDKTLEKELMENIIKYFNYLYDKKIKIKIIADIKKGLGNDGEKVDFNNINPEKYSTQLFTESYKMMLHTNKNKKQIIHLLVQYLNGKFDNLEEVNQYNTKKNKDWLEKELTTEQKNIWLSNNKKVISIGGNTSKNIDSSNDNTEDRINHHFLVAIDKIKIIKGLGFDIKTDYKNVGEIMKEFNINILKLEEQIKKADINLNIFDDLKLQIDSINQLRAGLGRKKQTNEFITIEKELNPLKSLMMGNWVDGSCLSYYSAIGNYYSAIANTVDVNKGVFYIRNSSGNLLGRCLITIGEDKKISRYNMYYSGSVGIPIDEYFDEYIIELSEKLGLELNGDEYRVENIESDDWLKDGIKQVFKPIVKS